MTSELREEIERVLDGRCRLSEAQWSRIESHHALLLKWNRKLNLTRIRDVREAAELHYGESLLAGLELPQGAQRIADLGSGGGFPGIPVAILRPDCQVTLVERDQRKAVFLREATRDWGNVRVVACDAATLTEEFDWVLIRAVRWADIAPLALRLAKNVILLAGDDAASEGEAGSRAKRLGVVTRR